MPALTPMPVIPDSGLPRVELTAVEFDVPIFQLTPESILQMLQIRLGELDEQIETTTSALQNNAGTAQNLAREIQQRRELLNDARDCGTEPNGNYRWADYDDDRADANSDGVIDGHATRDDLLARFHELEMDRGSVTREPNIHTLEGQIQSLEDRLREVNSGNEMLMVSLQSTMQQRTSAVQMATNMLKSIDESTDSIVGNLR